MSDIEQVRRFHRLVTQRAGVLEESYLSRGRPLSEARVLFEIGAAGADSRDLRARLQLDSGYFTRLLGSLEKQGLIETKVADDARRRRISLTPAGAAERQAYEELSDRLARSILEPLSDTRRKRLVEAMAEVERGLNAGALSITLEDATSAPARACFEGYFAELAERFEGGFDADAAGHDGGGEFAPPKGLFFLAWLHGEPVGCGGLVRLDDETAEIKRVWTSPSSRGLGVARALLDVLESHARDRGFRRLRLDTNRALKEAQAMYEKAGFRDIARYNDNPYAHRWFEKEI